MRTYMDKGFHFLYVRLCTLYSSSNINPKLQLTVYVRLESDDERGRDFGFRALVFLQKYAQVSSQIFFCTQVCSIE